MRPIAHGAYFKTLEEVAEAALEMCQWLDYHAEEIELSVLAQQAHERLHVALEPYERIKFGREAE